MAVETGSEEEGGAKAPKKAVWRKSEGAELAEVVREVGLKIADRLKSIHAEVREWRKEAAAQAQELNKALLGIYWGEHQESEDDG